MTALTWNHSYVKADLAWPLLPQAGGAIDWGDVKVAHLDTGYTKHEAFGPWGPNDANDIILAKLGRDFYSLAPAKRKNGRDPLTNGSLLFPGHGTRSGSALSGRDPNKPFQGIAPGLPLIPLRVAPGSLVTKREAKAIGQAIDHVVKTRSARIVSISLGFPLQLDQAMGRAVDKAYDAGVIVVAAAGQVTDQVTYPGRHRRTICVAGLTKRAKKYFNYNPYESYSRVDAWAPAKPIARGNYKADDRYGTGDGTTYATLHVTAAAAMWQRFHGPAIDRAYPARDAWMRIEAFRAALRQSQRRLPFKSPKDNHAGKLDIFNLLSFPLPNPASLSYEEDRAGNDVA